MRRNMVVLLAGFLVVLGAGRALALPTTINDDPGQGSYTASQRWQTGQNSSANNNLYDAIGNEFATQKMVVSYGGTLNIQIWTNNRPGGWAVSGVNWGVADLGISRLVNDLPDYDGTLPTSPFYQQSSPYAWGIVMQNYAAASGNSGSVAAQLVRVSDWSTTWAEVNGSPGAWYYGGAYKDSGSPGLFTKPAESRIKEVDEVLATGTLSWALSGNTVLGYTEYLLTLDFPGFSGLTGQAFEVIWSTAKCGNDIIQHGVDAQVPVPATILLLSTGLVGLAGLKWRRRS